jgi:hypothetical protein
MQAGLLQSWIRNRSFFHNSFSLRLFNLNHIMSVLGNFEQANVPIPEQKKDPNKPKGARRARIFFSKDNRGRISKDNPHCTSVEVTKICEKEYKTVDAKTKAKYVAMHVADVIRFNREMKTYTEGGICGLSLLLFLLQTVHVLACFV